MARQKLKAWPKYKGMAKKGKRQKTCSKIKGMAKNKGTAESIGKPCLLDCSEALQAHSATSALELVATLYLVTGMC